MIVHLDRKRPSSVSIRRLSEALGQHRPVVLPTETQYALACDATSAEAVNAVRAIKGRDFDAPFSIFLPAIDALARWRIGCPDYAKRLTESLWPGPLTLILPTSNPIFKFLGGDGRSAGIRVTPEPVIAMLLDRTRKPLVATSANPSGAVLDPRAENQWLEALAMSGTLVWARPPRMQRRAASTIIDCTGKVPREIRPGPITKAEWNAALARRV